MRDDPSCLLGKFQQVRSRKLIYVCAYGALSTFFALAACSGPPAPSDRASMPMQGITTMVSATTCGSGWKDPVPGLLTFQVRNASSVPMDVAFFNAQTSGVYSDLEAIGPGTTKTMRVNAGSGSYAFQCDPGSGNPITGPTVVIPGHAEGSRAVVPPDVADTTTAVSQDRAYVTAGLATVGRQTATLASDIRAGNLAAARDAWLAAHLSFERLGSAYGMFGNYDKEIDGTPSGLPRGVNDPDFTGFYRIEYGLWHDQSAAELSGPTQQLVKDVKSLQVAYPGMIPYPQAALSDLALRTHEILEHTVRFQLSGADDFGSGTTLATADANIGATLAQLAMLRPMLLRQYPELSAAYTALGRLQYLIDVERAGSRWIPADKLRTTQREAIDSASAEAVQLLAPIVVMFESSPLP
jgi:iron uptake system EfeUOB component EfeO/EfeM